MNTFSHLNENGAAKMVDVGDKAVTRRTAVATGRVTVKQEVIDLLKEKKIKKGDVLATARIAGIMAAKKVDMLIPLCHTLSLNSVDILFKVTQEAILIKATASNEGKTGVEMEALTAASVAALTIFDMCKSVDKEMVIDSLMVVHKSGGRSGTFNRLDTIFLEEEGSSWL